MLDQYAQALQDRVENQTLRALRSCAPAGKGEIEINGKRLVNFSSNDYLGLSQHPALAERSIEFVKKYGTGSGASRLLSGNLDAFEKIEKKLADLKGAEAALILPSGFQANSTVLAAALAQNSIVAADKYVHRSIIEGLQLSSSNWFRYKHNDLADLEQQFERRAQALIEKPDENKAKSKKKGRRIQNVSAKVSAESAAKWIVTESVFSMDGDTCKIDDLLFSAAMRGFALFIDEAHATGVTGENGMGMTAGKEFSGISMGTFGKALGSFGAYVCCSKLMREYLINFCSGLIYSTALPPAVLGAIDAALDIVPEMDEERLALAANAEYMRSSLKKMGFDTAGSTTQIIPIILGSEESALNLCKYLEDNGFCVPAIRPPTVPSGSSRLRVSLSAVHTLDQIDQFLNLVRSWHEKKN